MQWLRDGAELLTTATETQELAESVSDNGGVYFVPALKLCLLVMIGVRADGRKELIALAEIWGAKTASTPRGPSAA